ncbi:hypothetical protein Tco_0047891 [Tanacetum coccineum]
MEVSALEVTLVEILGDCQGGKWSLVRWGEWDSDVLLWSEGFVPNVNALRKCILEGPYTPSTVIIPVVLATDNSLAVPERTTVETVLNMSPENKAHFESEKEAIHLILIGIRDENISTVDGMQTTMKCGKIERLQQATRHKGKEIAKQITPLSQSASKEDSDPEQAQKDKEIQKNLALIAKNQRTMTVAGARETVGGQEVSTVDSGTDSEPLEQVQYDTRYNMFVNEIQHSEQFKSISNTCVVETGDSNVIPDSSDMCDNDIQNDQNAVECDDERVALANLIAI